MLYSSSIAIAHVKCSFNNTLISITSIDGSILASASGGIVGFKGHKRSTSYAALTAAKFVAKKVYQQGVRKLYVSLTGLGSGRKSSLKGFLAAKLQIIEIKDFTSIPHNGCKESKKRRV